MWLIKAALRNPYMVATLVFMILVLGPLATLNIPVDILPVFKAPAVEVLTYYQGMPASAVEKTITNRIERWVNQAPGAGDIEKRLKDLKLPEGMHIALKGEYARMNESFKHLMFGLLLATVLVYLLQVALFRSWVGPFIIMFTVPLGLMGVFVMLFLTRTTLNVQSEMGMIFLVGIEVNTGVLLVEFANKQRKLGLSVRDAIVAAATIRFRPILMTFFAAFFALLPMAFGIGRGSEANVPLARAVVGGMLASTLLARFVLPILYTLLVKEGGGLADADIEKELEDRPEEAVRLPHDDEDVAMALPANGKPDLPPAGDGGAFRVSEVR